MVIADFSLPWVILFAPLLSAILITLFFLKNDILASVTAIFGILASFVSTAAVFLFYRENPDLLPAESSWTWLRIDALQLHFGFLLDSLSILMLLIVTGVGSCIFIYSSSYMKGDKSYPRYFAYLSLFAFSMIGIVLSNNFVMLFFFWELVAVSSYLLIGFWFEKPSAADAGNKAFIVNRVADFGMVLGILWVWMLSGAGGLERTFNFAQLSHVIPQGLEKHLFSEHALLIGALLVFCGVVGKSAQFPLYIWLPDAMEGPTPVSALIHAATMVAAGVFMLSRVFFLVSGIPEALEIIAIIGGTTAVLAALIAIVQNDIKKILAYSTVSQLGYMVMALGLGSSVVGMYHLTTHAFFKALLFLGAGALIHGYHTQDIWEMGSALKKMPITTLTFLVGTFALCGIWPLSGFFSKDEILTLAHDHNPILYYLGLFTAALTAFYMTRALWIAIFRPYKELHHHDHDHHGKEHAHHEVHDAPWLMKLPLLVLAVLSVAGGFMGIPQFLLGPHGHPHPMNMTVAITSSIVAIGGILIGTLVYARARDGKDPLKTALAGFYNVLVRKYYLDEFFEAIANFFQKMVAGILYAFDLNVVMKRLVDGTAGITTGVASFVRRAQTGRVQSYAMMVCAGFVLLIFYFLFKQS